MYDDHHSDAALMRPPDILDYSLTGENVDRAIELGVAEDQIAYDEF